MHALLLSLALVVGGAISPVLGATMLVIVAGLQFAVVLLRTTNSEPFCRGVQVVATLVFDRAFCLTMAGLTNALLLPMLLEPATPLIVNRDGLPDQLVTIFMGIVFSYMYLFGTWHMQALLRASEWQQVKLGNEVPVNPCKLAS